MVSATKDPLRFNDLMATLIDFSKYVLNRLKINNLTQDILLGPAYDLLKGMCSSSVKLEYHFQECFNALTDRLDWNNPEEDRYPFDLSKHLPLHGHPGHLIGVADYFFNNDLEYLKSSDPERTYTTSIMKTKAARYEIEGIEDMVPMLWSPTKVGKLWGVKSVSVKKLHEYGLLEDIVVKRDDRQFYKFKEELYTPSHKPPEVIYEDLTKQKRVMRADELYKFSDGTFKKVQDELHHRVRNFYLEYNKELPRRK
ncbi:hypothetical protein Tco_0375355 [Tanacetum coccineum]